MNARPWPLLATALLAVTLTPGAMACSTREASSPAPAGTSPASPADDPLAGESIFALDLSLVDQQGRTLTLADLGGQPLVAAMVYTSCTSVCIMVTEEMKAIEKQLAGRDRGVRYVLFSLDPGRDTPAAMRQFAADHRLDTTRWSLYATSDDGVRDLAAVLGVKYRQEDNGEIAHSAMIFVIDRQGVVRHRQVGVKQDPAPLIAAVTGLAASVVR